VTDFWRLERICARFDYFILLKVTIMEVIK